MMLFVFGLIGLVILGLTKRPSPGLAITLGPVPMSKVSITRSCSQCGAGMQDQLDALFPERRATAPRSVMKKSGRNMSRKSAKTSVKKEWPVVVYLGTFGLGFLGYIVTRVVLDGYPHPIHWASGLAGALIGFIAGWIWYRWRGDII